MKDAFVVPGPLDALVQQMFEIAGDPDMTSTDLALADARARIGEAMELAAITVPPFETDTWPACRPLLDWVLRKLPEGGTGYQRPEWDDDALVVLADQFFGSPLGRSLDDSDHRDLLDSLLWFGTDYGPGDPLRWSPVVVEILLVDWLPRKIVADVPYLAKAPELLRAFVRFCDHERGIRADLTEETVAAIDRYAPDYQQTIRLPRPQGPAALLAALSALDPDDALSDIPWDAMRLNALRRAVGGEAALDRLDTSPLPDEPFSWAGIPGDIHGRVKDVLTLIDRCCDELLNVEYRTASRRFLARVAAGDPQIFRRRGRADTAASAVCWVIGKANDLFAGGMTAKELIGYFGLNQSSISSRAQPMLGAIGAEPSGPYGVDLGSPEYLVSGRRQHLAQQRDRCRAAIEQLSTS